MTMDMKPTSCFSNLRNRLTFKFFATVTLCSAAFAGASIALQLFMSYRAETARIEENVKFIEKSYIPSIADSLYKLDEPLLRLLLRGALQLPGVRYCQVTEKRDEKGYRVSEGDPNGGKDIKREFPLPYRNRKGEQFDIGALTVFAGFEEVRARLWEQTSWNILISAFQIFATAFIVFIIFRVMVSRHLSTMAGYARELNVDNLGRGLKLNRRPFKDELGRVADAINDLRERLRRDIARRERREEELRFSHDRFRVVMDSLDAVVYIVDMETHELLFINKFVRDYWGDVAGETCWKALQANQTGPCPFCTSEKLLDGDGKPAGVYVWEFQNTKDNQWYECRDQAIRWTDGRIVRMEIATNITERKRAEEELRQLRNYLSNIINSMPSVLVGVDPDGRVTQWNSKAQQTTRVPVERAVGRPLARVYPRMTVEMDRVREAMRTREAQIDAKRARLENDETIYEDVIVYPLISNGVEGVVIRIDDVTEKIRMEELMLQSEKMLSVGGLAAGMAHEINNPMAAMMQTANVLASRLYEKPDMPANLKAADAAGVTMEAIKAFMEARGVPRMIVTIMESGRRVANIVDNMLSFARKSEAIVSSHNMEDLLDKSLKLAETDFDLKKRYDFKKIEIKKEYENNLPPASCEGAKIQQVLLNIFRNGSQAMQAAGAEKPRIIVRTHFEQERNMIRVEIEDNGPGMDEKTRKRIFEPFFTTKPEGVGTGLGLSVSYFIITENHKGEMAVESRLGSGAKFIIRLPAEGGARVNG